ncbi:MAG TPA: sugar ABC transporter substrate-binding protein [Gaiella sp.]|jgi:ribose transport system substrate-binding protein
MTAAGRRTVGIALAVCLLVAAVAVVTAPAVGSSRSTATAGAVKPYPGFEKSYRQSFPIPKKVAGKTYTIGCQNPVGPGNETTTTFCKGVQAEAAALGMKYIGLDDGLSIDKQVSNFNQLLARGADAIALYPLAPNALRASLAKAKRQGVAVIGFNVTFTKSAKAPGYDAQIWEGRDAEAYLSVAELARIAPRGKVVIVGIGAPVPAIKYLAQRYRFWAKKFGLQVIGEQDNPTDDIPGGRQAMSGLVGKYSDIDGVLAYNDESAVGAYTAARSAGRNDIKIIGINGSTLGISALDSGHVAAIVQVDAVGQGAQAAAGAYNILTKQGGRLPKVVVMRPKLLTKDNLDSATSWSDQLAQIKGGSLRG